MLDAQTGIKPEQPPMTGRVPLIETNVPVHERYTRLYVTLKCKYRRLIDFREKRYCYEQVATD